METNMMILRTPDHVFIGDEVEIATQILDHMSLPLTPDRLQHLAVAMLGCTFDETHFEN
ncbi:hypothetical protein SFC07_11205 [Corynebacterium callunae]|uniref:hypothetical protein n=1 Tax=Corynebacterium callunae TaxID=1721 RepID=UPI00398214DB